MKKILLLLFLGLITASFSQERETYPIMKNYYVSSDELDENIPEGYFVVEGDVKMFSSASPLDQVQVASAAEDVETYTDSSGFFQLELKDSIQDLFFFKEGWNEYVIEDYHFRSQHRIKLTVYLGRSMEKQIMRKPLLYLYADEPTKTTIQLKTDAAFTFTYPAYEPEKGWEVTATPSGAIECNNKQYPYLFWEAETKGLSFFMKRDKIPGAVVASEDLIPFFENNLSAMGLNDKESADFITYWVPLLSDHPHVLIQFLNTEQYGDKIAEIEMNPAPESVQRIFMFASAVDNPTAWMNIEPQYFDGFNRSGLTLVEWGGAIIDLNHIQP
ncbi:MAG: hypothetical protein WDZ35_04575 [Crocinitomicaceae bacterium]